MVEIEISEETAEMLCQLAVDSGGTPEAVLEQIIREAAERERKHHEKAED